MAWQRRPRGILEVPPGFPRRPSPGEEKNFGTGGAEIFWPFLKKLGSF